MTNPQTPATKPTKTIGQLIEAICPEPIEEMLPTYEQTRILNAFALNVSSIEEWEEWITGQGF